MNEYHLTHHARTDLDRIYDYIAFNSPEAARRLLYRFHERFRLIAEQPGIGEPRNDLVQGIRVFSLKPYAICYSVEENDVVSIARVIHTARDFERVLRENVP